MKTKLGDITKSIFDGKHGDCEGQPGSGLYFVSVKDLTEYDIDYRNAREITEVDFQSNYMRTKLENGDTIYANTGDTIGKSIYVKDNMLVKQTSFQKSVAVIKPDEDKVDSRYLYYLLKYLTPVLRNASTGSAQKNLLLSTLRDFDVNIHDRIKQIEISSILGVIDDKIRCNINICTELEDMAQTLYNYWFTQFDFPNEDGKPYHSSGGEIIWNEQLKREIPKGWDCSVISNHIDNNKGGDWGKEEAVGNYTKEVTCIRGADFPSINSCKSLSAPTRYIIEKNAYKALNSGDLIVEISGGSPTQSTGRICYINDVTIKRFDNDIITSNFCRAFSTKNNYEQYWLYLMWQTLYDAGVLFGYEGKTTGIKNLLFDDFCAQYHIAYPEENVLKQFHEIVSPIFEKIQQYNIENDELVKLRDWLLPMLMNGQAIVK